MPNSKLTEMNYDIHSTEEMCGLYTTYRQEKKSMWIIGQKHWWEEDHLENQAYIVG